MKFDGNGGHELQKATTKLPSLCNSNLSNVCGCEPPKAKLIASFYIHIWGLLGLDIHSHAQGFPHKRCLLIGIEEEGIG